MARKGKFKFKLDKVQWRKQILLSDEMQDFVNDIAEDIARETNQAYYGKGEPVDFKVESRPGKKRARAVIVSDDEGIRFREASRGYLLDATNKKRD